MKKIILTLAVLAVSMSAYAKDVTKLSNSEVTIEELKVSIKTTNGKVVKIPVSDENMSVSIDKKFTTSEGDVILLAESTGGNACPATYIFVKINKSGQVNYTPSFGTCSDLIKVNQQGTNFVITMPNMNAKGTTKYLFNGITITENGKAVK